MKPFDPMRASGQPHRFALREAAGPGLRRATFMLLCAAALAGCAGGHAVRLWTPAPDADASAQQATAAMDVATGHPAARGAGDTVHPHPCGAVVERRVHRLPPPGAPGHVEGSELAVEFDAEGRVLRRWAMPVDAVPVALAGDRLGVAWSADGHLVIATDGGLSRRRLGQATREAIDCPAPLSREFPGSEYLGCALLPDADGGQPRRLAFESPCT